MKKAIIFILISAFLITVLPVFCAAEYGDGVIKDVELDADGTLSWEDYPKAKDYWIGVDGGFTPANNGMSVSTLITAAGTYRIELEAYTEDGEKFIAAWSSKVIYDGFVFKLISDGEQTVTEVTTSETEEETQSETEIQTAEEKTGSVSDTAKETETSDMQSSQTDTETENTQKVTETETEGQDADGENSGSKWIIAVLCVVIAVAGVSAVLFMQKRTKENK